MAARRCSTCGIDFPVQVMCCHVCGEATDWMDSAVPDTEWERTVELRTRHHPSDEAQRVERWRLQTALDLGYDVWMASSLAASDADLHTLELLIRRGCPLELAARIV